MLSFCTFIPCIINFILEIMKKTLLTTLLFGGLFVSQAQTTFFFEDFNGNNPLENWTLTDTDGDTFNWNLYGQPYYSSMEINSPVVGSFSFNPTANSPLTPDNWLISPAIDLTNATGTITLSWQIRATDPAYDNENYSVYVGTSADTTVLVDANIALTENTEGINTFTDKTLDISAFAGQMVYVAFRHHNSTNQFCILLDNIKIVGESNVSVDSYLTNHFSVYPNPTNGTIKINNTLGASIESVYITDANGRVVKRFNNLESIDIAELNAGVYFVNINSTEGNLTKKIMKE